MNPARHAEAIKHIRDWFDNRDRILRATMKTVVRDTTHGIWGPTGVDATAALCERLGLHDGMRFCDLGSGDGRVAMVAALSCDATGIEGDAALDAVAHRAKRDLLSRIPELARCALTQADYTNADLSGYDIIFSFADHSWPENVERALLERERPGMLVAHQDIFRPLLLRKGPTIWIGQTPFVTYPIGKPQRT